MPANRVLLIAGAGPGISRSTALLFGKKYEYKIVLVSRTETKLQKYTQELRHQGVDAEYFVADLRDAKQVRKVLTGAQAKFGPISALLWGAYHHHQEDILDVSLDDINSELNLVASLIVATQDLVKHHFPDVKATDGKPALLLLGGGTAMTDVPGSAAAAVQHKIQVAAMASAAKRNFVASMQERLKSQDIVVGEVIIMAAVKHTPFDHDGVSALDPDEIAQQLWRLVEDPSHLRTIHMPFDTSPGN